MATYPEWLFSGTLDDLRDKLESKNTYQTLMISGLLRKLLLDGGISLMHQVNRFHRLKIRFSFIPQSAPGSAEGVVLWGAMDGFDPVTARPGRPPDEGDLDDFLGQPIFAIGGQTFTVAEVISHLANVMGGVHAGKAEGRDQLLLEAAHIDVGGAPALVRSLLAVGRISHRALLPLRQAIVEDERVNKGRRAAPS